MDADVFCFGTKVEVIDPDRNPIAVLPTPRYSAGTMFAKTFPGHGTFIGYVKYFDGEYYRVYYPEDGDSEDMGEEDFECVTIVGEF